MPIATQHLEQYLSSLLAMTPGQNNRFTRALQQIERLADQLEMSIAVAGGLAGLQHETGVTTLDIDLVIPSGRADEFGRAAESAGFRWVNRSDNGWHRFVLDDPEGEVSIECLPAGKNSPRDAADAPPIPEPGELGVLQGIGYANLTGWVLMKLVANRDKDRYHLGEAVKRMDEAKVATVVQHLRKYPLRYLQEFHRILQASQDQDSTNW
ncbi:hypothetical protein [Rhodopirellula europaea]|uniref:Uncharacterized protein n=1 Tax=Rhodopirellula europaea SH398 TaxID=1263868 RepID=M5RZZ0_9BACT|nr:hypothetical protein [Rhodopirellula europaea]EMI24776.1 hypothetical protein RESH_04648 [Rhodopirellula europaea SH398]